MGICVRAMTNVYIIYCVVHIHRSVCFLFTVNRALFRCFLSPHHAQSSIARPLPRKFVFQNLINVSFLNRVAPSIPFSRVSTINGRQLID